MAVPSHDTASVNSTKSARERPEEPSHNWKACGTPQSAALGVSSWLRLMLAQKDAQCFCEGLRKDCIQTCLPCPSVEDELEGRDSCHSFC